MIIYSLFLIPFFVAAVLWLLWGERTAWWEMLIILIVSTLLIIGTKFGVEYTQVSDIEYWTNKVTKAEYHEGWTEEWYTNEDIKDSKGRVTGTRRVRHTKRHPPEYYLILHPSGKTSVSRSVYRKMASKFGNEKEKDLYHSGQCSWGDGDMYYSVFRGARDKMTVATTEHRYENRVRVAKTVFDFPKVTDKQKKDYRLFDYPKINDPTTIPSILGNGGPTLVAANKELCRLNAELGPRGNHRQVRLWVLIWQNQSLDAGMLQEGYWFGGNKNELVACIGTDSEYNVKWAYVFSWSEEENLKIDIRSFIRKQKKLDLVPIVDMMGEEVEKQWIRKQFKDFSYLTVEPPLWAFFTSGGVILLINIGISLWVVLNSYDADGQRHRFRYQPRWRRRRIRRW